MTVVDLIGNEDRSETMDRAIRSFRRVLAPLWSGCFCAVLILGM